MKRIILKKLVVTLIVFTLPQIAGAQWVQTGGSIDSYVYTLSISGENIYAGTYRHGVYLSKDNGVNWEMINSGLTYKVQDIDIQNILVKGEYIFAGSYSSGIFRTSDSGKRWDILDTNVVRIASLTANDSTIFAGTYNNGVYVSSDNGTTWTASNGPKTGIVLSLVTKQNNIFAGTVENGVFYSSNNGAQWTTVNSNFPEKSVYINNDLYPYVNSLVLKDSLIFAATWGYGIVCSSNNGKNWASVNTGLTNLFVNVLLVFDTVLYAGTGSGGVFYSNNNGSSWNAIGSGLPNFEVRSIGIKDSNIFVGTWGGGIWRMQNIPVKTAKYKSQSNKINTNTQITSSEYFNLHGQKISMKNPNRIVNKSKMIIMRNFDNNGRIVSVLKMF